MANNNNRDHRVSKCHPTVTWETMLVSKIGIWVINNGETTVVIIKKTVEMRISSNRTNTNYLKGVTGIAVVSVVGVVGEDAEGRLVKDTKIVESENHAHFSRKGGEYTFTLSGNGS